MLAYVSLIDWGQNGVSCWQCKLFTQPRQLEKSSRSLFNFNWFLIFLGGKGKHNTTGQPQGEGNSVMEDPSDETLTFPTNKKRNNQELSLKLRVLAKHSRDTRVDWEALTAVKPSTDVVPSQERKTRLLHHKKLPEKPAELDTHTYTQAHTYFPTLLK